jgi:hypothetical protein
MSQTYGTKVAEAYSARLLKNFWLTSIYAAFTNQDYEGELKSAGTTVNLLNLVPPEWMDFDGNDFTWDEAQEIPSKLVADQIKVCKVRVKDLQTLVSQVKNPSSTLVSDTSSGLKELIDSFVLSFYPSVAAGNRIGLDYTTGTVAVAIDGTVTGTGTTFTSDMVGRGFKASGQSSWYRVKTFTSATSIVIEKDSDDLDATYDGGVIAAGATFVIEAVSPITVTKDNIFSLLVRAQTVLDNAKIPVENRSIALRADIANLLELSTEINPSLPAEQFNALVVRGYVGQYANFRIFKTPFVNGDASGGFHCLGCHRSFETFAMALLESETTKLEKNFGTGYKSLAVWGAKVADVRRQAGVELFVKV